jgi:large subunit ribosomal protein L11
MQIKNYNQLDITKITRKVSLIIPAQTAKLGPPVGPVLGQVKIKVKDFCTLFNDATSQFKLGLPLRVIVFVFKNETFNFIILPPSNSFLLKNSLKFSKTNSLTVLDIYKIALIKKQEFEHLKLNVIFRNILHTAKLLKIKITLD